MDREISGQQVKKRFSQVFRSQERRRWLADIRVVCVDLWGQGPEWDVRGHQEGFASASKHCHPYHVVYHHFEVGSKSSFSHPPLSLWAVLL